jgi:NAD(P)-dependent dehydrogenase (short-subunit alcohol dehydrogenase family)
MADAGRRVVVVGASSGLGRCIGVGLGQRGSQVALLARRKDRLEKAAAEAGPGSLSIECDVTSDASCSAAIEEAAAGLGGIDAVVYAPAIGHLARIEDIDSATWQSIFATNVVGASAITAAALPHLKASKGVVAYLSSVTGSETPPWRSSSRPGARSTRTSGSPGSSSASAPAARASR